MDITIRERGLKASIILGQDPQAKVLCPVCQKVFLKVTDIKSSADPSHIERVIYCSACGARSYIRMGASDSQES